MNNIVKEELKKLEQKGKLSPLDVIDAAKNPKSPLHQYFEWDDTEAARKYRIEQARELIRTIKIEVVHEETIIKTVKYARDPMAKPDESMYVAVPRIKAETFTEILQTEIIACIGHIRRVEQMAASRPDDAGKRTLDILKSTLAALDSIID
jgi:hypothetical protein